MNTTDTVLRRGFRVALDALVRCRHAGHTGRVTWVSACGRHCRVLWNDRGKQTYESVCNLDAPSANISSGTPLAESDCYANAQGTDNDTI